MLTSTPIGRRCSREGNLGGGLNGGGTARFGGNEPKARKGVKGEERRGKWVVPAPSGARRGSSKVGAPLAEPIYRPANDGARC